MACVIEEGDDDVAGDREGSACVYDCGWSPVKREMSVDLPEPVMEGFSWGRGEDRAEYECMREKMPIVG